MDFLEYIKKTLALYTGKVDEAYNYVESNVSWQVAFLIAWGFSVISGIVGMIYSITSLAYPGMGNTATFGLSVPIIVGSYILGMLIITPILFFLGPAVLHLLFKIFGGQAAYIDTLKHWLAASIFIIILNTGIILIQLAFSFVPVLNMATSIIGQLLSIIVLIWSTVILTLLFARVHKISYLKSFLGLIIPLLLIFVLSIIIFLLAIIGGAAAMTAM